MEEEIANRLKQNITPPPDTVLSNYESPVDTSNGQATISPEYQLDEMTLYKVHDLFGEAYKNGDSVKRSQAEYVFNKVAELVDSRDYGFVAAKIRELERMIGTTDRPDRMYRLYQWLKLDSTRKSIDSEMASLSYV